MRSDVQACSAPLKWLERVENGGHESSHEMNIERWGDRMQSFIDEAKAAKVESLTKGRSKPSPDKLWKQGLQGKTSHPSVPFSLLEASVDTSPDITGAFYVDAWHAHACAFRVGCFALVSTC